MEKEWCKEWLELSGGLAGWEELCARAADSQDARPFAKRIPESLDKVVEILLECEGWVSGTDYPVEAVSEVSPSGLLLQTEHSAAWLIVLNDASAMDLGLHKPRGVIWDCLEPSKYNNHRRYTVTVDDEEEGSFSVTRMDQKGESSDSAHELVKREKVGGESGIQRAVYHLEKVGGKNKSRGRLALFFVAYPADKEPYQWDLVMSRGGKKRKAEKALRMRPSHLTSLAAKVPEKRDLSKAKAKYTDEKGGVENLKPGEQVSDKALQHRWAVLRETENLPRLGRGGTKAAFDDSKLRATLNRNSDLVLSTQLEINPNEEEQGLRIALRSPLAKDDLYRCCLAKSLRHFRSGLQVDTSFGDYYLTAVVTADSLFVNEAGQARTTPLLLMLHERRCFGDYAWLGQALGSLSKAKPTEQRENGVLAVATDGDQCLVDGFLTACPLLESAAHAGCMNHMQDNIKTAVRTKFPLLLPCQQKLLSALFGVEYQDGREEGGMRKRSRRAGLVDCVSTSLRTDWMNLRQRLETEVVDEAWGPAEEADQRLAAFLDFCEYAEANWVERWENSFCLNSRDRFYHALGQPVTGKVVTNRVEGIWPDFHEAFRGRQGLHELVECSCAFLRQHYETKKAAILGMETKQVKLNDNHRSDFMLSTNAWVGLGREEAKSRALAKVWPVLRAKCADPSALGGVEFEGPVEILVSATHFALPLFSEAEAKAMDRAAKTLIDQGAVTKLSMDCLSLLEKGKSPAFIMVKAKAPLVTCQCRECAAKSPPYSAVTAHTLAAVELLGPEFGERFRAETEVWLETGRDTERTSYVSPNKGKKGPMALRRYGSSPQVTLVPPDRISRRSGPAQATLQAVLSFIKEIPDYLPTNAELQALAAQRRNLYQPSLFKHHNDSPVFIIRIQDCINAIVSNYKERQCASCLRRIANAAAAEPGDLMAFHLERMLKPTQSQTQSGKAPAMPSMPPPDSVAVGKRWVEYERDLEQNHGYRYSRPSNLCTRAYHPTYACLVGRFPYIERSQIKVHSRSQDSLSSQHRAFLALMFGCDYPSDTF